MSAADAQPGDHRAALRGTVPADRLPLERLASSNVNVVRPLTRASPVDSKFSQAFDLKLRRLKEGEIFETNVSQPPRRIGMGALAVSECDITHAGLRERTHKNYASHPQINVMSERRKTFSQTGDTPSPVLKGRLKHLDAEKPRFVTTVKSGQFLLPPPQVAYLLGLHTLYPPPERERIVYSYASRPKAVATRPKRSSPGKSLNTAGDNKSVGANSCQRSPSKQMSTREAFRGVRALVASVAGVRRALEEHDRLEEIGARNLMHERRVVRGSTYGAHAPHTAHAHAHAAGDGAGKARRRALARRAALARLRPGTPPPAPGRRHLPTQTEHYLQELFDKGVEMEVGVQTDLFADRPATPPYVPAKTGTDAYSQIYPGDLFDFDVEVQPVLEVLVGKTAEQALAEVAHEEELAALRAQQRRHRELRDAERAERQRLLAQDIRLRAEKEARVGEARAAQVAAGEARARVAAATLVQGYVAELLPSVLAGLREHGYLLERVHTGVSEEAMPWLIDEVSQELESIITSRDVITEIVRDVVEARALALPPRSPSALPSPPSPPSPASAPSSEGRAEQLEEMEE